MQMLDQEGSELEADNRLLKSFSSYEGPKQDWSISRIPLLFKEGPKLVSQGSQAKMSAVQFYGRDALCL